MKSNLRYFRVDLRDFCIILDNLYVEIKEDVLNRFKISLDVFVWNGGCVKWVWKCFKGV